MRWLVVVAALVACSRPPGDRADAGDQARARAKGRAYPLAHEASLPALPPEPAEPDGADDGGPFEVGPGLRALAQATAAEFVRLESPPAETALPVVCDVTPFGGWLFVAHSVKPVVETGAVIHRYDPEAAAGQRWSVAFDWGAAAPARGWHSGGGQGFTRIRAIDGRLLVPDTDTPGPGFRLSDANFEEYVFVSDEHGEFGAPGPGGGPPPGTRVVPYSFHNFDVIRFRGSLVVSTGTGVIAPGQWGPFPAGLAVGELGRDLWPVRFEPGSGTRTGVLRATFMHRFKGRLYIGFQNNERRARWDAAIFTGPPGKAGTEAPRLVRFTGAGGWLTHRWASGGGWLYWIGSRSRGGKRSSVLYQSEDGIRFRWVPLPEDAGRPQDLVVVGESRILLTSRGLFRSRAPDGKWRRIAPAPEGDPFGAYDGFCSAPLAAAGDALYAGGTRDGHLYRLEVRDGE